LAKQSPDVQVTPKIYL